MHAQTPSCVSTCIWEMTAPVFSLQPEIRIMQRLNLILLPSALALALPGWAGASEKKVAVSEARPLNLSIPQDVLARPSGSSPVDETARRNLSVPAPTSHAPGAAARPANLPYGAGYEHRHQEMWGASGSSSGLGAGPGAGAGAGAGNGAGRGKR